MRFQQNKNGSVDIVGEAPQVADFSIDLLIDSPFVEALILIQVNNGTWVYKVIADPRPDVVTGQMIYQRPRVEQPEEFMEWIGKARRGEVDTVPVSVFMQLEALARGYERSILVTEINQAIRDACQRRLESQANE